MKQVKEFTVVEKKQTFDEAKNNVPEGYRLPTQKELMLMYCMNDENKFDLPKGNVWSDNEYIKKDGTSTAAFAIQFSNGYTGTINKSTKSNTIYVKS